MNSAILTSTAAFVAIAAASVLAAVAFTDLESRFHVTVPNASPVSAHQAMPDAAGFNGRSADGAEARVGAARWMN